MDFKIKYKVFPTCRKGRLRGIEIRELATSKFGNFSSTETSTIPPIATDLMATTCGCQKLLITYFYNMCTLHGKSIQESQNADFLQPERKFKRYKLSIIILTEVSWWDPRTHPFLRTTPSLVAPCFFYSRKPGGSRIRHWAASDNYCKACSLDLGAGF